MNKRHYLLIMGDWTGCSIVITGRKLRPLGIGKPLEMPFGLRTRVGPRNHLLDVGAPKVAQIQWYSIGGANVPLWEGTLAPPGDYDWTFCLRWRCGQITLTICSWLKCSVWYLLCVIAYDAGFGISTHADTSAYKQW